MHILGHCDLLVEIGLAEEALDVVKVLVLGRRVDNLGRWLTQNSLEQKELVDRAVHLLGDGEGPEILARSDGPCVVAPTPVKRLGRVGLGDRHGLGQVVDRAVLGAGRVLAGHDGAKRGRLERRCHDGCPGTVFEPAGGKEVLLRAE